MLFSYFFYLLIRLCLELFCVDFFFTLFLHFQIYPFFIYLSVHITYTLYVLLFLSSNFPFNIFYDILCIFFTVLLFFWLLFFSFLSSFLSSFSFQCCVCFSFYFLSYFPVSLSFSFLSFYSTIHKVTHLQR